MTSLSSSIAAAQEQHAPKSAMTGTAPIAVPIAGAMHISGMSRSAIYRELAGRKLQAIKAGSRTLVLVESLHAYLAALPPATFRAARAA